MQRVSSLKLSGPRVLLRKKDMGEAKVGAIIIPDEATKGFAISIAEVVDPGTGEYIISTGGRSTPLYKAGDLVLLMRPGSAFVRVKDEPLMMVAEKEIVGVVTLEADPANPNLKILV